MQIQVRYFAVFRERLGRDREVIEVPEGANLADALALLTAQHPAIAQLAGRFQAAVNQTMSGRDTVLEDGDELALIPPVAGGTGRLASIVERPPSIAACTDAVMSDDMGGLVTFTGVVRNHNRGQDIDHLEYEAYQEMAEKVMSELCDEIEAEIEGTRLAVEHRVGRLEIGEIAVVIAAAAAHRQEAFAACRAMIDRLKERVPIWKKEVSTGGAEWIGLGP